MEIRLVVAKQLVSHDWLHFRNRGTMASIANHQRRDDEKEGF